MGTKGSGSRNENAGSSSILFYPSSQDIGPDRNRCMLVKMQDCADGVAARAVASQNDVSNRRTFEQK